MTNNYFAVEKSWKATLENFLKRQINQLECENKKWKANWQHENNCNM